MCVTVYHSIKLPMDRSCAQDMHGLRSGRIDSALQRSLSLAYTSLASVLLSLRSSASYHAAIRGADAPHVPWRDSPLTKWLQPALSRAVRIVIIGTVAPGVDAAAETLATLHYVSRFRTPSGSAGVLVKPSWQTPSRPRRAVSVHTGSRSNSPALKPPPYPPRPVTSFPGWPQARGEATIASHPTAHEVYEPRSPNAVASGQCEPDYGQLTTSPVIPGAHAFQNSQHVRGTAHASAECGRVESAGLSQPQLIRRNGGARCAARLQEDAWASLGRSGQCAGGTNCATGPPEDTWAPQHEDAARSWQEAAEEEQQRQQRRDEQQLIYREVLAAIRRSGGNLREEALLEQLMHDIAAAEERVRHFALRVYMGDEVSGQK